LNSFLAEQPEFPYPQAMVMKSYTEKTCIPFWVTIPLTEDPSALSISFNMRELISGKDLSVAGVCVDLIWWSFIGKFKGSLISFKI
jgi:hypothetical protein